MPRSGRRYAKSSVLLALCALPFALALWQWQRGEQRSAAQAAFARAQLQAAQPVLAARLPVTPDGRRLTVTGARSGPALYWRHGNALRVWLPLQLGDGSQLLVDIGQGRAQTLPDTVRASGFWQPLPRVFTLPGAVHGSRGVVDAPARDALVAAYPRLRPGVLVLEQGLAGLAASPVKPPFDPRRHYAYALQWLLLGLAVLPLAWRLHHGSRRAR